MRRRVVSDLWHTFLIVSTPSLPALPSAPPHGWIRLQAAKTARTLELYQGRARGSRLRTLVWNVWVLLRTVGTISFFLFVYVAVSEDALRSRGVDVYRLAH